MAHNENINVFDGMFIFQPLDGFFDCRTWCDITGKSDNLLILFGSEILSRRKSTDTWVSLMGIVTLIKPNCCWVTSSARALTASRRARSRANSTIVDAPFREASIARSAPIPLWRWCQQHMSTIRRVERSLTLMPLWWTQSFHWKKSLALRSIYGICGYRLRWVPRGG